MHEGRFWSCIYYYMMDRRADDISISTWMGEPLSNYDMRILGTPPYSAVREESCKKYPDY